MTDVNPGAPVETEPATVRRATEDDGDAGRLTTLTSSKETSHGDRPSGQENTAEIDIRYEVHG